jgi:hypothetical protein
MSAFEQQPNQPIYGSNRNRSLDSAADEQNPNMSSLSTTSYDSMAYFQSSGPPSTSPPQRLDQTTLNSLLYEQGLVGSFQQNQALLQQHQSDNVGSIPAAMMRSMSPSTMTDHLSPEPFSQDGKNMSQFGQNQMTALPNSQFGSPMMMSDDGQSTYTTYSYDDTAFNPVMRGTTNMHNSSLSDSGTSPNFLQQTHPGHNNNQMFMTNERPTNLSLGIPNFGNTCYPQDDSHIPTPTNASMMDINPPPHLRSPIVRIENYEDLSQEPLSLSRSLSTHSQGSKRSNNHLSPYGNDEISNDGTMIQQPNLTSTSPFPTFPTAERNDDGSWVPSNETGQRGINPIDRASMGNATTLTLDEIEQQRRRAERIADVQEWLTHSSAGSEDEGDGPRRSQHRRRINRPRARSANDITAMRANQPGVGYLAVPGPPGPGVLLNESSDFDDEEGEASWQGSDLEDSTPPVDPNTVNDYFISQANNQVILEGRPWTDSENKVVNVNDNPHQPVTANAAIMAYRAKIKDTDTASLTATIGSRRRSVTDLDSLFSEQSRTNTIVENPREEKEKKGLLNNIMSKIPSRTNSRKRRSDAGTANGLNNGSPQEGKSPQLTPRRSFVGRPKLDTNVPVAGGESRSPGSVVAGMSATFTKARNALRNRSKSDTGKNSNKSQGYTQLMNQHGRVPGPNSGPPTRPFGRHLQVTTAIDLDDDSDDDGDQEGVSMDLTPRLDMLPIPNRDGFKYHILTLNPNINHQLLERLTLEQDKRYNRLSDARKEHDVFVMHQKCTKYCPRLGGSPEELPPRAVGKNADIAAVTFRIIPEGMTEQDLDLNGDSQSSIQPAQFPIGIPIPPTHVLPSKFECTYCFKVKDFKKPSDWTKHIHEDVQPFTCTFPDCTEPKSFKRKADWVRHENERHRQLESWVCDFSDCNHVCYRRDNFVQHLVREHKVPEPKIRTGRNSGSRSPITPEMPLPDDFDRNRETPEEYVARVVERCLQPSPKDPRQEPCRFCGNICTSWKKLTVHLAKHMEQIALPVILLLERNRGTQAVDASHGFGMSQMTQPTNVSNSPMHLSPHVMPTESAASQAGGIFFDEPADLTDVPTIAVGNSSYLGVDLGSQSLLDPSYAASLSGSSYPPTMIPGNRSRASSTGEAAYGAMRQGTTYPPTNIPSSGRGMDDLTGTGAAQMYGYNGQQSQGQQPFFQNPFGT